MHGSASPNHDFKILCFYSSCLHCSKFHFVLIIEESELTILTTTHGDSASCTTPKVCFLTSNYGHNKLAELEIGKFIFSPLIRGSSWPASYKENFGKNFMLAHIKSTLLYCLIHIYGMSLSIYGYAGGLAWSSDQNLSYHKSWQFAIAEQQNILSWWRRL